MIEWYKDENIGIFFDSEPCVAVQYPLPNKDSKDICAKPFLNKKDLSVVLVDYVNLETYEFTIPKGYCWDGATIPRIFWRFIGPKTDNRFLVPSLIHDVLCENHQYVGFDRYFSTKVFERLLYVSKVPAFKRWMMFHSVDNFQKFCGWKKDEL